MRTEQQEQRTKKGIDPVDMHVFMIRAVRQIGTLLQDQERVQSIVQSNNERLGPLQQIRSGSYDLASGLAGQCLLFAEMDRVWPDESWDAAGHRLLVQIQIQLQTGGYKNVSLFGGLTGVATAVSLLSRSGSRYVNLSGTLQDLLLQALPALLEEAQAHLHSGVLMQEYDVISGLSGIGRYLLLERKRPEMQKALLQVLAYLVELCREHEKEGLSVPRWYLSPDHYTDAERMAYPNGDFNVGLSHGISGPLALLSLALANGVEVPGQREAILYVTDWLLQWKQEDEYGVFWPSRLRFEEWQRGEVRDRSHREAWCYGSPGVARVLWLAGAALGREEWKQIALESYRATFRRPVDRWDLSGPTFCHGLIGLLHLTNCMYQDSGEEELRVHRDRLLQLILDTYDEASPFGFFEKVQSEERGETEQIERHAPGLLSGAAGVALVLLGILEPQRTEWDCVFLIR